MIKFLFFLFLMVPQALAFAVTPTTLQFNNEQLENEFIIFNTEDTPKEFSIIVDSALIVKEQLITLEPKSKQTVTIKLDKEKYVSKNPIIYIKENSDGNINKILGIKTNIDFDPQGELFQIREIGHAPTEIITKKNIEKIISFIIGSIVIVLILIKTVIKYKGGKTNEIKFSS